MNGMARQHALESRFSLALFFLFLFCLFYIHLQLSGRSMPFDSYKNLIGYSTNQMVRFWCWQRPKQMVVRCAKNQLKAKRDLFFLCKRPNAMVFDVCLCRSNYNFPVSRKRGAILVQLSISLKEIYVVYSSFFLFSFLDTQMYVVFNIITDIRKMLDSSQNTSLRG